MTAPHNKLIRIAAAITIAWLVAIAGFGSNHAGAQLTPGFNLPDGGAIGQIPVPQIGSTNLVLNTSTPTAAWWALVGTGTRTPVAATLKWSGQFTPQVILTTNGVGGSVQASTPATVTAATVYAISGQLSVDPAFGLTAPSPLARIAVVWTGGVGRTDSIDIIPAACNLAGSSNVSSALVESFAARIANGTLAKVCTFSFLTIATPALTTSGAYTIFPRVDATTTGRIVSGAWQIETPIATAFIPTSQTTSATRPLGATPLFDTVLYPTQRYAAAYTYESGVDNGKVFEFTAAAKTLTLPATAENGESVTVINGNAGNTTIAVTAPAVALGPGFINAGVASFTVPYSGTGTTFPNSAVTLTFNSLGQTWEITGGNLIPGSAIPTGSTCAFTATGLNNCPIGVTTANSIIATTIIANSFVPNSATIPSNGIFLPAADTLGWSTSSAEKFRMTASGNMLVGTTTETASAGLIQLPVGTNTPGTGIFFGTATVNLYRLNATVRTDAAMWANQGLYLGGGNARVNSAGSELSFELSSSVQMQVLSVPAATRYLQVSGSVGGNPSIATNAGDLSINPSLVMGATSDITIPNIKSATGVRYICVDTGGKLVSQAAACVGT